MAADIAAPERWLESRRRSRRRRLAAARATTRRRLGRRGTATLLAVMMLGTGAAVAGQQGSSTAAVQRALGVSADGIVGPQTRAATKRFQRSHGLVPDGVVGAATLRALGLSAARSSSAPPSSTGPGAVLDSIARCESGGDPTAVSADGQYRGKYQFSRATWRSMSGKGDPAAAPEAVQDRLAAKLYASAGSSPWPNCA